MLEADRDVHQAVIAEKQSLVAVDDQQHKGFDQDNADNIQQAYDRLAQAAQAFETAEAKQEYEVFKEAFAVWKEKTRKVVEQSKDPGKITFARKSSDTGSAFKSFNEMREHIDRLQQFQAASIEARITGVEAKKERVNAREQKMQEEKDDVLAFAQKDIKGMTREKAMFQVISLSMGIVLIVFGVILAKAITGNISKAVALLKDIAQGEGDLTRRLALKTKDEIGELSKWFDLFVEKIQGLNPRGDDELQFSG